MKKTKTALCILSLVGILTSCSSSPLQENINFLNRLEAAFYYYGEDTSVYNKIKDYHILSDSEFPESLPYISAFVIYVSNKKDEISTETLDKIFSCFKKIVMFMLCLAILTRIYHF